MAIHITKGDATYPNIIGNKIIVHCISDSKPGVWGAGFVIALNKRWKEPKEEYLKNTDLRLGDIQIVRVSEDIEVCNLCGQKGVGPINISRRVSLPPIKYEALKEGLLRLREYIIDSKKEIQVVSPLIGCGLAMGNLEIVYHIVKSIFDNNINFTFFAFTDEDYEQLKKIHAQYEHTSVPLS